MFVAAIVLAGADGERALRAGLASNELSLRVDGGVARLRIQDGILAGPIARLHRERVRVVERGRVAQQADAEAARRVHARGRRARRAIGRAHRRVAARAHLHALPAALATHSARLERRRERALRAQIHARICRRAVRAVHRLQVGVHVEQLSIPGRFLIIQRVETYLIHILRVCRKICTFFMYCTVPLVVASLRSAS